MADWRTIDSAPQDGRHILGVTVTPTWDEDNRKSYDDVRVSVVYWLFGGFVEYPFRNSFPQGQRVTHWMPLPALPR